MTSYGQFCPLAQATQLLCERWTLIIVRELIAGSTRFSDIQKGVPLMSPTLLSARLKHLVKSGVAELSGSKGNRTYHLTPAGRELMWDIRRSVDPEVFPSHRLVVQFKYPDAPAGAEDWWLISDNGEVDLCLKDPGYDIDILIRCPLKVMTQIWICEKTFKQSMASGDVVIMGDPELVDKLQDWLRSSPLSRLGAMDVFPRLDWGFAR